MSLASVRARAAGGCGRLRRRPRASQGRVRRTYHQMVVIGAPTQLAWLIVLVLPSLVLIARRRERLVRRVRVELAPAPAAPGCAAQYCTKLCVNCAAR